MQIVILCGGLGTRLRPITQELPKSMITIKNKPFLLYQIELLKKYGITKILLCVGYLWQKIKEYFGDGTRFGVNITYSIEKNGLLGTAGALKNAEPLLDKNFLVMYGDSYLRLDYTEFISAYERISEPILMSVYKNYNRYDRSNLIVENGLVTLYEKNSNKNLVYIDYGVSIFDKMIVTDLQKGIVLNLEDIFKRLAPEKKIRAFEVKKSFYEIGSKKGLERFKKYVMKHLKEELT